MNGHLYILETTNQSEATKPFLFSESIKCRCQFDELTLIASDRFHEHRTWNHDLQIPYARGVRKNFPRVS
ncbi:hypothetical protein EV653_4776 [Kribbella pratensis]|uniref:Uncharacterized protein n=1 Tax=Kribbella pratensis TaxID=2512112 RepID=A0A4R8C4J6_9ACTN|nr:hypothetical protein EV653_4776 [Kribbella pratensis]